MLVAYSEIREQLIQLAGKIGELAQKRQIFHVESKVAEVAKKIDTDTFYIAAFGGFSSGKSTFFNAMLGERLFPAQSTPTTATINFLTYSEKRGIRVNYKTTDELESAKETGIPEYQALNIRDPRAGTSKDLSIETLASVSRESTDSLYVRSIEVFHDSTFLKPKGLVWIDTPGTDSVIEYHKSVTYSLIEQADAILFFIYAPVPFKNSDWLFLDDIRRIRDAISVDKFFFILNAIDGLEEQSQEEITKYVAKQLETKAGILRPQIFPISAKLALLASMKSRSMAEERELRKLLVGLGIDSDDRASALAASGFPKLQEALSDFLNKNKAWYLADASGQRLDALLSEIENSIQLEEWSLDKTVAELEAIEARLGPEISNKQAEIERILEDLYRDISGLAIDVLPLKDKMIVQMYQDIDEKHRLDSYTIESIIAEQKMLLKQTFERGLRAIISAYVDKISKVLDNFAANIGSALDIDFSLNIKSISSQISALSPRAFKREIHETVYDYERVMSHSGAGAGAVLGGLLAYLSPGGLGLLGGALLGSLFGGLFDRPKVNRIPRTITKTITDYAAMRKEAERIATEQAKLIAQAAREKLSDGAKGIVAHLRNQCEERLTDLRDQLKRIKSERSSKSLEANQRKEILSADRAMLRENRDRLEKLIAYAREKLDQ
jgi:hypothetical protein